MRHIIIEKVNKLISHGITSEAETLYLLAQIRKYLEINEPREETFRQYPTLSLFADWVLHSKLSGEGAKLKLKEYSDFFMECESNGMTEFMKEGFNLFSDLKHDLKSVFELHGFNQSLIDNEAEWMSFLHLIYKILEDLPLVGNLDIVSFSFHEGYTHSDGNELISFTIKYSDGASKSFTMGLDLANFPKKKR